MRKVARQKCEPDDLHYFYEGSKSFLCLTHRIFHFRKPPGLKLACSAVKRNGKFGRIHYQRSEDNRCRGRREVFFCKKTVRVKVKGKVVSTGFLKIAGWGLFVVMEEQRKGAVSGIGR